MNYHWLCIWEQEKVSIFLPTGKNKSCWLLDQAPHHRTSQTNAHTSSEPLMQNIITTTRSGACWCQPGVTIDKRLKHKTCKKFTSCKGVLESPKSLTQTVGKEQTHQGKIQKKLTPTTGKGQTIPNMGSRQILPHWRPLPVISVSPPTGIIK